VRRILKPGENCRALKHVEGAGLLIDGEEYYRAFYMAARSARKQILISGWQFDSEVRLVHGRDAETEQAGENILDFLNGICLANSDLEVYILAWDYSLVFALEREWFQALIFRRKTHGRVHFRFDSSHAVAASHHQKFVVIDGQTAFAGGMDICADRWDDRLHLAENPHRVNPYGRPFGPYHDVQAAIAGPAARTLAGIFAARWSNSGGGELSLPDVSKPPDRIAGLTLPLAARNVAISRTQARTVIPVVQPVREIRRLYLDAIASAERLIYMENQYFSSQAIYDAIMRRMAERNRARLQIVMIFPRRTSAFVEGLSMGLAQARMFNSLKEAASRYGHSLGLYFTCSPGPGGRKVPVYIHSKVLVVDDRFLTVGSANTTNRSMGLDTELNLSWEAASPDDPLSASIMAARVDLLREHAGLQGPPAGRLAEPEGLAGLLDTIADSGDGRLSRLVARDYLGGSRWLRDISPEETPTEVYRA